MERWLVLALRTTKDRVRDHRSVKDFFLIVSIHTVLSDSGCNVYSTLCLCRLSYSHSLTEPQFHSNMYPNFNVESGNRLAKPSRSLTTRNTSKPEAEALKNMHIGCRQQNCGFCAVGSILLLVGNPVAQERMRNGKDPGDPQPHINLTRGS